MSDERLRGHGEQNDRFEIAALPGSDGVTTLIEQINCSETTSDQLFMKQLESRSETSPFWALTARVGLSLSASQATDSAIASSSSMAADGHVLQVVVCRWKPRQTVGFGVPLTETVGDVRRSQETVHAGCGSTRTYCVVGSADRFRAACRRRPAVSVASIIAVASGGTNSQLCTAVTYCGNAPAFHITV